MPSTPSTSLKICLTCSHGGHLTEMLALRPAFEGHDVFYFCYDAETTRRLPHAYLVPNMARNPVEFAKNLVRLTRIFRKERPDVIVSTGAEIAIPAALIGCLTGVPLVYVECGAQFIHPSMTGCVVSRWARAFFVQWPELLEAYRDRARFEGSLIDVGRDLFPPHPLVRNDSASTLAGTNPALQENDFIYVTVGTMFLDFPRLIRKMDAIAEATGERIVIQTGLGTEMPRHCEHFDFKPREEVLELQRRARVIVCHAGIGSVTDALETERPLVVVPRRKCYREHMNDHQLELAEAIRRREWGRVVLDIDELADACANPPAPVRGYRPARDCLVAAIRRELDAIAAARAAKKSGGAC